MSNIDEIGSKIRALRKKRGVTLQKLSDGTQLSIGCLSNLERNISSPTLENMAKICGVLDTSIGDILAHGNEKKIVIRKNDREISVDEKNSIRCETVDFGANAATYMYMTIDPNSKFNGLWWNHEYDEVGTVISGEMIVRFEDAVHTLLEGDTILIQAHTLHCIYNTNDIPCVTYWAKQWMPG